MDLDAPAFAASELRTDRLVLRGHGAADFDAVAALWGDPRVVRFIGGTPDDAAAAWARLLRQIGHWCATGYGYWAVTGRDDGAYVGQVGFADNKRGIDPALDGMPEAGWVFSPAAQGRGLASEAMAAAMAWADAERAWPRSFCILDPSYRASERVAEKLGYRRLGIRRWRESDVLVMDRALPPRP